MKRALYLGHKKSCVYNRIKKKRKTEIQRVKTSHHVCVEGHALKGKKRVTRLKYICILGNRIECTSTLKMRHSMIV